MKKRRTEIKKLLIGLTVDEIADLLNDLKVEIFARTIYKESDTIKLIKKDDSYDDNSSTIVGQ